MLKLACLVVVLIGLIWYVGWIGAQNPSPGDITAKCRAHGAVVQIVPEPWPAQRVRVVCRDGSVFDAP